MDWSNLYPDFFTGNPTEKESPQVEFADIGCGYGGLLGSTRRLSIKTTFRFLLLLNLHHVCVFILSALQWSYLHFSQINSCWVWRSGWKCQTMCRIASGRCAPRVRGATRTSPAFAAMPWSTSPTSFSKDRWVCCWLVNQPGGGGGHSSLTNSSRNILLWAHKKMVQINPSEKSSQFLTVHKMAHSERVSMRYYKNTARVNKLTREHCWADFIELLFEFVLERLNCQSWLSPAKW